MTDTRKTHEDEIDIWANCRLEKALLDYSCQRYTTATIKSDRKSVECQAPKDTSTVCMSTSFLSLPAEIRNMIYTLLLRAQFPINIRSPLKKRKRAVDFTGDSFGAILSTSKQIHDEAAPIFYSLNQFVVGIGHFGSTVFPNLHGLKAFISRVPAQYLSLIQRVLFVIQAGWVFVLSEDALDTIKIARILSKHFTGLHSMLLYWNYSLKYSLLPRMPVSETHDALVKTMRVLVTHPSSRQLFIRIPETSMSVEDIVEEVRAQELDEGGKVISAEIGPLEQQYSLQRSPFPQSQFHLKW